MAKELEARAREVLADVTERMAPAGKYVARDILSGNLSPDNERAIAAMLAFRDAAAPTVQADAGGEEAAHHFHDGMFYYRGLLDQIAEHIGLESRRAENGDDMESVVRARLPDLVREAISPKWLSISDDAKSGALVELVVDYSDGDHPLADGVLACTIGFNTLADTGEDEWKFAGWCWSHDHFVQGKGAPIAWRPSRLNATADGLPPLPARAALQDRPL